MFPSKRMDYIENSCCLHVGIFMFHLLSSQGNYVKVIQLITSKLTIRKSGNFLDYKITSMENYS